MTDRGVTFRTRPATGRALRYDGVNATEVRAFLGMRQEAGAWTGTDEGGIRVTCPVTRRSGTALPGWWIVLWDADGKAAVLSPGAFSRQMEVA